jgi:RNA polymerase sigma factor (sigma-70 family)
MEIDKINKLYAQEYNIVCNICKKASKYKNFDYDELHQNAYILFVDICNKYQPFYKGNNIPFLAYCRMSIKRRIYAYIQNYNRKNNKLQSIGELDYFDALFNNINVSENIENTDTRLVKLLSIMHLLSEGDRNMIDLILEDNNSTQIAKILGVSCSTVHIMRKRLILKIKQLLK